jgi:hypothetical protein
MKNQNLEEFKELINRYETITIEEINEAFEIPLLPNVSKIPDIKIKLTGFGTTFSCSLCAPINENCGQCVYKESYGCLKGRFEKSYNEIEQAETSEDLFDAYRNRAKVLRNYLKEIE